MSERRMKIPLKGKIKRESRWLKEDLTELREKIPKKVSYIAAYAVLIMGYFFLFDKGLEHPETTVIGSIVGAWIGIETAILIAKGLGISKATEVSERSGCRQHQDRIKRLPDETWNTATRTNSLEP